MKPTRSISAALAFALLGAWGCSGGGGGGDDVPAAGPVDVAASREFRAITGISMGAFGALNLGTRHSDRFGVIGSLGGPVDLTELLRHLIDDNLEVKPEPKLGDDHTFDHLPPYPSRDTRLAMMRDLMIALGNPFLHHPDPVRQFLAADSEPAIAGRTWQAWIGDGVEGAAERFGTQPRWCGWAALRV